MDSIISDILTRFEQLCAIPRPSGSEDAAAAFLAEQLENAGLSPEIDKANNLRCTLPGSAGMEHAPGVILQAHIDMVCVSAPNSGYHPGRDPIHTCQDGYWLCSDGQSTLGADNGIGAALMLWMALDASFLHPPMVLLFTAGEEQGLTGARALSPDWLAGCSYYINLDAFRSDAVITGSAGGLRQCWSRSVSLCPTELPHTFELTLSGLTGGHSGFNIHLGRLNALTELGRFLRTCPAEIADLQGGTGYNAIPTQAGALLAADDADKLQTAVEQWTVSLQKNRGTDPNLNVSLKPYPPLHAVWDPNTRQHVLDFLTSLPQGVLAWQNNLSNSPARSGNPARISLSPDGQITIAHMGRAASRKDLDILHSETDAAARAHGFTLECASGYAPWESASDNPLVRRICAIRRRQDGTAMEPVTVHVGLESSVLLEKAPCLTGVSLGFDILDAHSTRERVRLDSIGTTAHLLLTLLQQLGEEEYI